MKKQIFTLSFALCAAFGYAQNSATWPATGNVGIGTTTPTVKLDVVNPISLHGTSRQAFFGSRVSSTGVNTGLFLEQRFNQIFTVPSNPAVVIYTTQRIASVKSDTRLGYIDFNAMATTNTTESAVSIGNNATEFMRINQDGKVRIGLGTNDIKTPDGYKLFVEDGILTEKVKVAVKTTTNWADYVFASDYKLMPINEVEKYTKENNHLPNVPSASQMVENGLDVAQMDAKLMEKVEELTLYIIEQNKVNENQAKEIDELKAAVKELIEKK